MFQFCIIVNMQSSKKIGAIIKLIIVGLAVWFLYQKVFVNENVQDARIQFLSLLEKDSYLDLILVFLLMFVNWSFDAIKWQYLISKIENVSFWLALKAVFLGITVSMFTPNRVGEFGGRIFCLKKADRIKAVLITIFGNINQLVATITFGLIALVGFSFQFSLPFLNDFLNQSLLLAILAACIVVSLFILLLNVSQFSTFFMRWKPFKKYEDYSRTFEVFSSKEILVVQCLSIFRYFIYSFQFYLLIRFVNIDISLIESLTMSSLTFFSMSVIPTIALTEIGVRGSVAVFFFGYLSENVVGIMTAAFSLWLINLVIPAIIGVFFVYQLKFFRS